MVKSHWSHRDHLDISWLHCTVHALGIKSILAGENVHCELLFDIDFIFSAKFGDSRVGVPSEYLVAPATLVFIDPCNLVVNLGSDDDPLGLMPDNLRIDAIYAVGLEEEGANWKEALRYSVVLENGEVRFVSSGYDMYVRQRPHLAAHYEISDKVRGGVSFDKVRFDDDRGESGLSA